MNILGNTLFLHGFTADYIPFDCAQFSEFKYGNIEAAEQMGCSLGEYFVKHFVPALERKVIVYSSPYDQIPTSSYYLTKSFIRRAEQLTGIKIEFHKIRRVNTYAENYSTLSADERFKLISNDTYFIDTMPPEQALLIFVDDVSVTGTHQKVIEMLLREQCICNVHLFLYYAKLLDKSSPIIEDYINTHKIISHQELARLAVTDSFAFTTRSIKKILSLQPNDFTTFYQFVCKVKSTFFKELQTLALANKYDQMKEYQVNLDLLQDLISN